MASAREVVIELALGTLRLEGLFAAMADESACDQMAVSSAHAARVPALPRRCTDSSDHMLGAQAQADGLSLVSHDARLRSCEVVILSS